MTFIIGDIDNDGTNGTINDIVKLTQYNINNNWLTFNHGMPNWVADLDDDGIPCTINDIVKLAKYNLDPLNNQLPVTPAVSIAYVRNDNDFNNDGNINAGIYIKSNIDIYGYELDFQLNQQVTFYSKDIVDLSMYGINENNIINSGKNKVLSIDLNAIKYHPPYLTWSKILTIKETNLNLSGWKITSTPKSDNNAFTITVCHENNMESINSIGKIFNVDNIQELVA